LSHYPGAGNIDRAASGGAAKQICLIRVASLGARRGVASCWLAVGCREQEAWMVGRTVLAAVFGVGAVLSSGCSGPHHISYLEGLQSVKAIDQQWGACLKVVGVTVTHGSTGAGADEAGQSGLLIKLFGHANFFVTDWGTPHATAVPADDMTRKLVARAEAQQPDCSGRPSGLLPPTFASP
jgi:hypothetical protein